MHSLRLGYLGCVLFAGSCAAGADQSSDQSSGPGGAASSTVAAQASSSGFGAEVSTSSAGTSGLRCSSDLQYVVGDGGMVVESCAPDGGCFEGKCVPACDAAAASQGSIGCDFFAPEPPFTSNGEGSLMDGPCYAVFVANTWPRPAKLTAARGGTTIDITAHARIPKSVGATTTYEPLPPEGVPPNEVAILFLSHKPGSVNHFSLECPVTPAVLADAAVSGVGKGNAFRIQSDTPISAYDILPYGGATSTLPSATLLYPSTGWGTNYIAVAPRPEAVPSGVGHQWINFVGRDDATTITIAPTVTLPGNGTIPSAPQGALTTLSIQAGEIIQYIGADPTGMVVQSDKPVGVWTGHTYLEVETTVMGPGGNDASHQQLPHIKALGSEYAAGGHITRLASLQPEAVLYRIAGAVDGTTLKYEPAPPPNAPLTLSASQVVEFESAVPFVVKSQGDQHPFLLTQYMAGTNPDTRDGCNPIGMLDSCGLGDDEWITLVPPIQFLQRYVFFTDPTYATTNLVVVRKRGQMGFADVQLSCLGTISGFQPLDGSGAYEVAHVELTRGFVPVANCGTSRHEASSKEPFGVVVWGTDTYASYGYPAGGNIGSVNQVEVPPVPK